MTKSIKLDGGERAFLAALCAAADPLMALAELGVTLRVQRAALRLPGKQVFGAWDPLLRRIEIFGCDGARSDAELARTLGHEIGHVLRHERPDLVDDAEAVARQFAERWMKCLGPAGVERCAVALRARANAAAALAVPWDEAV